LSITCEICGAPVSRKRYYRFEGATLILCERCARLVGAREVSPSQTIRIRPSHMPRRRARRTGIPEELTYDIDPECGKAIRKAREAAGISREELARKLGIPESFLKKIEQGKLRPDLSLARKLERVLGIRIIRKLDLEFLEKISKIGKKEVRPLTLGDVIVIEKPKKRGEKK